MQQQKLFRKYKIKSLIPRISIQGIYKTLSCIFFTCQYVSMMHNYNCTSFCTLVPPELLLKTDACDPIALVPGLS